MGSVLLDLGGRLWRVDEGAEDHKQLLAKGAELVAEKSAPSGEGKSDNGPTVKELRAQADELGIPKSVKKRDDLVAAIAEKSAPSGEDGSDPEGETLGE